MRPFFMLVFFRNLTLFFHLLLHYIKVFTRLDTCRPALHAGRFSVIV